MDINELSIYLSYVAVAALAWAKDSFGVSNRSRKVAVISAITIIGIIGSTASWNAAKEQNKAQNDLLNISNELAKEQLKSNNLLEELAHLNKKQKTETTGGRSRPIYFVNQGYLLARVLGVNDLKSVNIVVEDLTLFSQFFVDAQKDQPPNTAFNFEQLLGFKEKSKLYEDDFDLMSADFLHKIMPIGALKAKDERQIRVTTIATNGHFMTTIYLRKTREGLIDSALINRKNGIEIERIPNGFKNLNDNFGIDWRTVDPKQPNSIAHPLDNLPLK